MKAQNMKDDGTTKGLGNANNNRTSDYMIGHFRAYKKATGDALWDRAVDRAYELLDIMQTRFSPGVGPDAGLRDQHEHKHALRPPPASSVTTTTREHLYHWNACRNPWRFASDYLLSGDARFASVTGKMIDFFQSSSGGNPSNIGTGYQMDGTQVAGGARRCLPGPDLCRRLRGQAVPALRRRHVGLEREPPDHRLLRTAEIQLLSMVVASGNWWTP
jgi:hypothetical protein